MTLTNLAVVGLASFALAVSPSGASGDGELPDVPGDVQLPINNSYWYTVDNDSIFESVGEGMIHAAEAALPVGIGVFAVTGGIPVAKKVIKQLSS